MAKYSFGTYGLSRYGEKESSRVYYTSNLTAWSYGYNSASLIWNSITPDPADAINPVEIESATVVGNTLSFVSVGRHKLLDGQLVSINGMLPIAFNTDGAVITVTSNRAFTIPKPAGTIGAVTLTGEVQSIVPTHWQLVKSFTGRPDNPLDGTFVDGDTYANFRNSYIDLAIAAVNRQVNYSLWVFNPIKGWIYCGDANSIVVQEKDTLAKVTNWIPRAWLNSANNVGDALGEANSNNDLYDTLAAYSFMYDKFSAEIGILEQSSSQDLIHTSLLPNNVTDLGFDYEPSLGDSYHRSLYRAGNTINGLKGNATSVSSYVTGLTHWGNKIVIGHNLMLDYNDSSFEESVGNWSMFDQGSIAQGLYSKSLDDLGQTLLPPIPSLYDALYPPRKLGYAVVTIPENIPSVTVDLPDVDKSPITYGMPVAPNTRYLFTGWVKALDLPVSITCRVNWFDSDGNFLGNTAISPTATAVNADWIELVSKSDVGRNGQMSPSTAKFATISMVGIPTGTATGRWVMDMLQLSEAKDSFEFEDARRVRIYAKGSRENYISNPSFEQGVGGWTSSLNGSFAQDPTIYNHAVFHGGCVGELTVLEDGQAFVSADWVEIDAGQTYTFSAYVSTEYPTFGRAVARIEFSNRESIEKQIEILTDQDGAYYDPISYYADSEPVTLETYNVYDENGDPVRDMLIPGTPVQNLPIQHRVSVSAIAPQYSKDSGAPMAKCSIYFPDASKNLTVWVDSAQLQDATDAKPYFDGSGAPAPEHPIVDPYFDAEDCVWESKNIINFIDNPSFVTTNGWTVPLGTLTIDNGPGMGSGRIELPNGAYGETYLEPYMPLFGTTMGKLTLVAGSGTMSTVVYLPAPAIGGEDVTVSLYIRAVEGHYTISTNPGQPDQSIVETDVIQHDQFQWIRLHTIRQLLPGETSFILELKVNAPSPFYPFGPPGYTIFPSTVMHIDGVQAEYGRIPNKFVDPVLSTTSVKVNPGNPATNIYMTQSQSEHGGKSNYFYQYGVKLSRLTNSLDRVMPYGSSWCVKPGIPIEEYPDLVESLIPSASFEANLGEWSGVNSNISRVVTEGSLSEDYTSHAAAYCKVLTEGTSGASKTFGITTGKIPMYSGRGYYASVALRPGNDLSFGTYTLKLSFYNSTNVELDNSPAISTTTIVRRDRWAYLSAIAPASVTYGATYAKLSVSFTPDTFDATQTFHIDRAVFRE
jgi:hypothetical protein